MPLQFTCPNCGSHSLTLRSSARPPSLGDIEISTEGMEIMIEQGREHTCSKCYKNYLVYYEAIVSYNDPNLFQQKDHELLAE